MVSVKLGVTGAAGEPKSSGDREETEASTGSSRSPGTAWHTTPGRWRQAPGSANRSHRPTLLVGLEVHCFHHHEVMPVDLSVGDPLLLLLLLFLLPLTLLELGPFYTVTHLKGAEQRSAELNQGQLPRRLSPPGLHQRQCLLQNRRLLCPPGGLPGADYGICIWFQPGPESGQN